MGRHDHVRPALEALGVEQVFWGIALLAGKPTWFGARRGEPGTLVFALPGGLPAPAIVTFTLLAQPAIRTLLGDCGEIASTISAILTRAMRSVPDGLTRLGVDSSFATTVGTPARPESRDRTYSTSMVGAQALAIIPTATEIVSPGERVEILPLD